MSGSESITIASTAAMIAALTSLPSMLCTFLLPLLPDNLLDRADRVRQRRPHLVR